MILEESQGRRYGSVLRFHNEVAGGEKVSGLFFDVRIKRVLTPFLLPLQER